MNFTFWISTIQSFFIHPAPSSVHFNPFLGETCHGNILSMIGPHWCYQNLRSKFAGLKRQICLSDTFFWKVQEWLNFKYTTTYIVLSSTLDHFESFWQTWKLQKDLPQAGDVWGEVESKVLWRSHGQQAPNLHKETSTVFMELSRKAKSHNTYMKDVNLKTVRLQFSNVSLNLRTQVSCWSTQFPIRKSCKTSEPLSINPHQIMLGIHQFIYFQLRKNHVCKVYFYQSPHVIFEFPLLPQANRFIDFKFPPGSCQL